VSLKACKDGGTSYILFVKRKSKKKIKPLKTRGSTWALIAKKKWGTSVQNVHKE